MIAAQQGETNHGGRTTFRETRNIRRGDIALEKDELRLSRNPTKRCPDD